MDLLAEIDAQLEKLREHTDPEQVTVTTDANTAARALAARRAVLVVMPPTITFQTWDVYGLDWEIALISPERDPRKASIRLTPILTALAEAHVFDQADPDTYEIGDTAYAAYRLTAKE